MKNKFKNKTERKQHSFYKEANNSILGSQKFTPTKVRKKVLKLTKWATFLFLIIVTIWGCVNEIILKTSHDLGQGMEFYQKDEFIYPNMYATQDIIGYTAAKHSVTEGVNNNSGAGSEKDLKKQTNPFKFTTINPFYDVNVDENSTTKNLSSDDKKKLNDIKDQLVVPSDKYYTITKNKLKLGSPFTYNFNEVTAKFSDIFSYLSPNLKEGYKGLSKGLWAPGSFTLPKTLKDEANKELKAVAWESKRKYSVSTWTDFLYFLVDKSDGLNGTANASNSKFTPVGNIAQINGNTWDNFFNLTKDANKNSFKRSDVVSINGTFIVKNEINSIDDAMKLDNWTPIFSIKDKTKEVGNTASVDNIIGQAQIALNNDAFLNGTLLSKKDDFFNKTVKGKDKTTLKQKYDEEASKAGQEVKWNYLQDVDYSLIKESLTNVYCGAQVAIIPIKKGFPIRLSKTAKNLIQGPNGEGGFRDKGFQNKPLTDNKDQGFDPSVQNFGWVLIDNNGDIRSVHEKDKKIDLSKTEEENALYGDQRRLGWGVVPYDDYKSKNLNPLSKETSVFDERVKDIMNRKDDRPRYLTENKKITIGKDSVKYDYDTPFAGVMPSNQATEFTDKYKGVLPSYDKKYNKKTGKQDTWESSLLSDSALATGQDSWAKGRVTFIGWADWGKAWDTRYGPLYGGFVFPIAQMAMSIGDLFGYKDHPWGTLASILLIVFLVRGLGTLLSAKGTKNQLKMQEVQTDVAKIKARYARYDLKKDKKMKQKQQAEIMALYKKNEVNPAGSLGTIFITMPIFISLWIIISALPAYKIASMGAFSFAVSAWYGIFHLGTMFILYLMVGISVGLVQGVSSKLPTWLANKRKGIKRVDEATKKAMKKQNRTQNIMVIVFIIIGLTVPALFAFYWIASGLFTIFLEFARHAYRTNKAKKVKEGRQKVKIIKPSKNV